MKADAATATIDAASQEALPASGAGKVLVLGQGTSSFLTVIRSLGRRGIEVHTGWCPADCPALKSRYVARHHAIPPYVEGGDWERELVALVSREHFDLVLPTNEQSLRPLQRHRTKLQEQGRIYLLDDDSFDVIFDKSRSLSLAESLGLRVPRSRIVNDLTDAATLGEEFGWPVVLKPLSSYSPDNLGRRREVVKAYGAEELASACSRLLAEGPILAQQCFVGVGVGVELLAERGEVLVAFQHERVHQPPRGGASSYRRSVALRADLVEAASRLIAAMKFTGVIMVEFLVDPRSDDWRFVEMNGRFWGSLPLAVAAGVDFPHYLYQLLVSRSEEISGRNIERACTAATYRRFGMGCRKFPGRPFRCYICDCSLAASGFAQLGILLSLMLCEKSDITFVVTRSSPRIRGIGVLCPAFAGQVRPARAWNRPAVTG